MQARTATPQTGFTLLELVVVLVLMGSLSTAIFLHWTPGSASLNAQAGQVARTLRHAQALALAQGRRLTFNVRSSTAYAISDAGTVITDPQGISQTFNLINGATLTGSALNFDSLGRPVDSGGNLIASAQNWALSVGESTATISVTPLSGFVAVTP